MPSDIEKKFPDKWFNDDDDGGKNRFESDFLEGLLKRKLSKHIKWSYHKVFNMDFSKHVNSKLQQLMSNDLNVIVYNFEIRNYNNFRQERFLQSEKILVAGIFLYQKQSKTNN